MEPGQDPLTSIAEIAALFARDIVAMQPQGPYLLGGFCVGGTIAFELAQQLTAQGHQVGLLALFGAPCPTALAPHLSRPGCRHEYCWTIRAAWLRPGAEKAK